jgi:hypothetical protein
MSKFDETMQAAKEWLDLAGRKTAETVETQKIRLMIAKKKNDLSHQYEVLGKLYYRTKDSTEEPKGRAALCADIAETLEEIRVLEQQLTAEKDEDVLYF